MNSVKAFAAASGLAFGFAVFPSPVAHDLLSPLVAFGVITALAAIDESHQNLAKAIRGEGK